MAYSHRREPDWRQTLVLVDSATLQSNIHTGPRQLLRPIVPWFRKRNYYLKVTLPQQS